MIKVSNAPKSKHAKKKSTRSFRAEIKQRRLVNTAQMLLALQSTKVM